MCFRSTGKYFLCQKKREKKGLFKRSVCSFNLLKEKRYSFKSKWKDSWNCVSKSGINPPKRSRVCAEFKIQQPLHIYGFLEAHQVFAILHLQQHDALTVVFSMLAKEAGKMILRLLKLSFSNGSISLWYIVKVSLTDILFPSNLEYENPAMPSFYVRSVEFPQMLRLYAMQGKR